MTSIDPLSRIGAALASPVRSKVLCVLMDGRAFTAKELACDAGVTPATMTTHLQHLDQAGLTRRMQSGRHVYTVIKGPEIAELLEKISTIDPVPLSGPNAVPNDLRGVRSCYNHLAGRLGVAICDGLRRDGRIAGDDVFTLTDTGVLWAKAEKLDVQTKGTPVRACLDWTERRFHLAGSLASQIMARSLAQGWIKRPAAKRGILMHQDGLDALISKGYLPKCTLEQII